MPKRATITFSSDDAPLVDSEELHVYYCKWSGKHAMTTNCDLRRAPRRRTDNSSARRHGHSVLPRHDPTCPGIMFAMLLQTKGW